MVKHFLLTISIWGLSQITLFAQDNSVGINILTPNKNAVLDLVSPGQNQGLLVPRIATSNRIGMSLGTNDLGLIVFDTDLNQFYHWHTSGWKAGLGVLSETIATGDLEGTFPNITIKEGVVGAFQLENFGTAGLYGSSSKVVVVTVDDNGRVSNIVEMPISISSANIESLSILNEDLANGTITISKLNAEGKRSQVLTVDASGDPLWVDATGFTSSTLSKDQLLIGDVNNKAVGLPVDGDITSTNTGSAIDLQINPLSVGNTELIDDGVNKEKINADIAGLGLSQRTDGSLAMNVGNGLSIVNDTLITNLSQVAGNGLSDTNGQLALDIDELTNIAVVADNDHLILKDTDGALVGKITRKALIESAPITNINVDGGAIDGVVIGANSSSSASFTDVTISGTANLANGAIQTSEIEDGAITTPKIADSGVTSTKIFNETILAEDLATGAVTTSELLDGTILTADVADLQVTNAKIGNDAITNSKVLRSALTPDRLLGTQVTNGRGLMVSQQSTTTIDLGPLGLTDFYVPSFLTTNTASVVTTDGSGNVQFEPRSAFQLSTLNPGNVFVGTTGGTSQLRIALDNVGNNRGGFIIGGTSTSNAITAQFIYDDVWIFNDGRAEIQNNSIQGDNIDVTSGDFTVAGANVIRFNNAGGLDVTGFLVVDQATDLNAILNVDGATDLNSTLNVDGITTLNSDVTITDGATTTNINNNTINIGNATSDVIDLTGATNINGGNFVISSLSIEATSDVINLGNNPSDLVNLNAITTFDGGLVEIKTNLKLASGETVNAIESTLDATGDNTTIPTEKAVRDAISDGTNTLQTELNDTQTGAGLDADGDYVVNASANYISTATSLAVADDQIDAALATVQADIDQNEIDADAAILAVQTDVDTNETASDNADVALQADIDATQAELDGTQTGAGLSATGAYNANTGAEYIDDATSLTNADEQIAAQVKVNEDAIVAGTTGLQTELNDSQTGAGLDADGDYVVNASANYISTATSLAVADDQIDAALATVQADIDQNETDADAAILAVQTDVDANETASDNADVALQADIDATQAELDVTQTGAGLTATGAYAANAGAEYIDDATSLTNADEQIAAQVKVNEDAIVAGTTGLQTELNDSQTGAGLDADGDYVVNASANYISTATSLAVADDQIDAALATAQADIDQNETDADAAILAVQTDVDTNETASDNADVALQADIDATQAELDVTQTGAGLSATGAYNANTGAEYIDDATSLTNADEQIAAQVKVNEDAIVAGTTGLQTELDDTQTGAGLDADGDYVVNASANYISTATSLAAADDQIDAALATAQADIDQNEIDADAAILAVQTDVDANEVITDATQAELDATQTGAGLTATGAYAANAGAEYIDDATSLTNADDQLSAQVKVNEDAIVAGTTGLQTELNDSQTGAGLDADGDYVVNASANYISTATSLAVADDQIDAALATAQADIDQNEIDADAAILAVQTDVDTNETASDNADVALQADIDATQAELDATQTGAGLSATGAYNANTGAEYIDDATSLTNADEQIATQVKVNEDAIAAGTTGLQTELNDSQTGAGLDADGDYVVNASANYISTATSLAVADDQIDAALATAQADIDQNEIDADAAILAVQTDVDTNETASDNADVALQADIDATQAELDVTQTGAGLTATGAYNANTSAEYIDDATSLTNADEQIAAQVKVNEDAIVAGTTGLQTELNDSQTGAGLNADGDYVVNASANYISTATSLAVADDQIDAALATAQADIDQNETDADAAILAVQTDVDTNETASDNADVALQADIDATQAELDVTQTGAGLTATGAYNANTSAEYIDDATSLTNADEQIAAQVKVNEDAIVAGTTGLQTELNDSQTGAGLNADGDYVVNASANYISTATSLAVADDQIDAALATAQADIDQNETDADAAILAVQTDVDTNETASDNADVALQADIDATQAELDATQTGAGLSATGAYNANTSAEYIDDATSLTNADEQIAAQVKVNEDAIVAGTTGLQTELNDTQTGAGLDVDGDYVVNASANYISTATSLAVADDQIDAALATAQADIDQNETDADAAIAVVQGDVDTNEADADAAIAAVQSDVDANEVITDATQAELNVTQTGAGLSATGAYTANTGAEYIDDATSLTNADEQIATQVKVNEDAIVAAPDATQTMTNKTLTSPAINAAIIEGGTIGNAMPATIANVDNLRLDGNALASTAGNLDITAPASSTINLSSDATINNINIGTGTANKTISIGNNTGGSGVAITGGTGGTTVSAPTTNTANATLSITGGLALISSAESLTTTAQTITVGNRTFVRVSETISGDGTFGISSGIQDGQVLIIVFVSTDGDTTTLNSPNVNRNWPASLNGDSVTLIWSAADSTWFELMSN